MTDAPAPAPAKITRNAAKCKECGDVIESKSVHDWVSCGCGAIFVDGGREYLRRGGDLDAIEELSEESPAPAPPSVDRCHRCGGLTATDGIHHRHCRPATVWIVCRHASIDSVWTTAEAAGERGARLDGEWEIQNWPLKPGGDW